MASATAASPSVEHETDLATAVDSADVRWHPQSKQRATMRRHESTAEPRACQQVTLRDNSKALADRDPLLEGFEIEYVGSDGAWTLEIEGLASEE